MGLRNSVNLWVCGILLPKFFVRTQAPFCADVSVSSPKLFPFFSPLLSKVVSSDFIQNFIKKRRRVLL